MSNPSASIPYSAALVTGGAVRIGRAISLKLARMGLVVAIHQRNADDQAQSLAREIEAVGGTVGIVTGDLADASVVHQLIGQAARALNRPIDVLVNNASIFEKDTMGSLSMDNWDLHQAVNLRAPVFLSQAMAHQMPEGASGAIINLIDQRVLKLNPQYFSYTAAKSGLWATTRTMAQALAPSLRVNAISPGPTLANQFQSASDFDAESDRVLLRAGPAIEEITSAVAFLLETPSITGQMLTLDGGQHLAWRTPDITED